MVVVDGRLIAIATNDREHAHGHALLDVINYIKDNWIIK